MDFVLCWRREGFWVFFLCVCVCVSCFTTCYTVVTFLVMCEAACITLLLPDGAWLLWMEVNVVWCKSHRVISC